MYKTADGRFSVEQESGQWLVVDTEQVDELGLPMVRGPFGSLNDARQAIAEVRSRPKPASPLAARLEALPREAPPRERERAGKGGRRVDRQAGPKLEVVPPAAPPPPPLEVRPLRSGDEAILDRLTKEDAEFEPETVARRAAGQSARTGRRRKPLAPTAARRLLEREDVHLVVAFEGDLPIGFVLAYELPRRHDGDTMLFIYELGVRKARRREGVGRELLDALWGLARQRGVGHAFVLTNQSNEPAMAFFSGLGGRRQTRDDVVFSFEIAAR